MAHFAIAGIQMNISMHDNLAQIEQRLGVLMHLYPWVEMVVFSELCASGPNPASAEAAEGHYETKCRVLAQRHGIWIVAGSYFEKRDGLMFNTTPVISAQGEIVTRYSKIFPFTPYENETTAGTELGIFDVPNVGRFGVSICYDLWYPELTRAMVSQGVEVILNPVLANFIDRPADLIIAQASAAMFQSYIFSINGLSAGGNGYSRVIDPAGRLLHNGNVGEELIPIEIDLEQVRRQRHQGLLNMGQPLKSFRDTQMRFPIYREGHQTEYLASLGPLEKPQRPKRE